MTPASIRSTFHWSQTNCLFLKKPVHRNIRSSKILCAEPRPILTVFPLYTLLSPPSQHCIPNHIFPPPKRSLCSLFATVSSYHPLYFSRMTACRHHWMVAKRRPDTRLPCAWTLVLPWPVVGLWTGHFTFLFLRVLICTMVLIITLTSPGYYVDCTE